MVIKQMLTDTVQSYGGCDAEVLSVVPRKKLGEAAPAAWGAHCLC